MKWSFNASLSEAEFKDWESLSLVNKLFQKEEIADMEINFETFREVHFLNCKFRDVTFNNIFLGKVVFQNCDFLNVNFLESNLSKVRFINSKLTNVSFFESKMEDVEIIEVIIQYSKIENTVINNSLFDDVKLKENIHRHNKYKNVNFYKSDLKLENFIDTKCMECDFKTSHFEEVSINIDDLVTSTLSIINVMDILAYKGINLEQ